MPDYRTMSAVEARAVFAADPADAGPDVAVGHGRGDRPRCHGSSVRAAGRRSERPLVVYFHGGGFTIGNVAGYDGTARRLCAALGLPLLSVDYRLAPEHPFPAAADDAWTAFTWAAHRRSVATASIVAGDSAGANLAAVTARRAAVEGIAVSHQLLFYPCFDPGQSLASHRLPGEPTPVPVQRGHGLVLASVPRRCRHRPACLRRDGGRACRSPPRAGSRRAGSGDDRARRSAIPSTTRASTTPTVLTAAEVPTTTFDFPTCSTGSSDSPD